MRIEFACASCMRASVARNHDFVTSAAIDCRAYSASSCVATYCCSANAWLGPDASPEVELPVGEESDARQAAAVGHLAAAAREQVHLRIEQGAGCLEVRGRLLDARLCDAHVRVVRDRLAHEGFELRVLEFREPALAHIGRDAAPCVSVGDDCVGQRVLAQRLVVRRRREGAAGEECGYQKRKSSHG